MINHKSLDSEDEIQADWVFDKEKNGFVVKAYQDIKRGEEIFIDYGLDKNNIDFFVVYGFLLERDTASSIIINLKMDPKDKQKIGLLPAGDHE